MAKEPPLLTMAPPLAALEPLSRWRFRRVPLVTSPVMSRMCDCPLPLMVVKRVVFCATVPVMVPVATPVVVSLTTVVPVR